MNEKMAAACPSCNAQFQVAAGLAGKQGKCPQCQSVFTIGGGAPAGPPQQQFPPPAAPPPQQFPPQPGPPQQQQFPPQSGPPQQQFPPQPGPPQPQFPPQPGPPQQQFPPQQQQFGGPGSNPYGPPAGGRMEPHRGGMILGLGIAGLLIIAILGLIAVIMGQGDLKKMDQGLMDPSGRGQTKTGVVLGWISVGIWILLILAIMGSM